MGTNWILIATLLIPSTNRVIIGVDTNTGIATQVEQVVVERRSTYMAASLEGVAITTNYVRVAIPRAAPAEPPSPPATNYTKLKGLK